MHTDHLLDDVVQHACALEQNSCSTRKTATTKTRQSEKFPSLRAILSLHRFSQASKVCTPEIWMHPRPSIRVNWFQVFQLRQWIGWRDKWMMFARCNIGPGTMCMLAASLCGIELNCKCSLESSIQDYFPIWILEACSRERVDLVESSRLDQTHLKLFQVVGHAQVYSAMLAAFPEDTKFDCHMNWFWIDLFIYLSFHQRPVETKLQWSTMGWFKLKLVARNHWLVGWLVSCYLPACLLVPLPINQQGQRFQMEHKSTRSRTRTSHNMAALQDPFNEYRKWLEQHPKSSFASIKTQESVRLCPGLDVWLSCDMAHSIDKSLAMPMTDLWTWRPNSPMTTSSMMMMMQSTWHWAIYGHPAMGNTNTLSIPLRNNILFNNPPNKNKRTNESKHRTFKFELQFFDICSNLRLGNMLAQFGTSMEYSSMSEETKKQQQPKNNRTQNFPCIKESAHTFIHSSCV